MCMVGSGDNVKYNFWVFHCKKQTHMRTHAHAHLRSRDITFPQMLCLSCMHPGSSPQTEVLFRPLIFEIFPLEKGVTNTMQQSYNQKNQITRTNKLYNHSMPTRIKNKRAKKHSNRNDNHAVTALKMKHCRSLLTVVPVNYHGILQKVANP